MSQVLTRRLLGCVVAAIVIAVLSQSVHAHTLWIQSSRYRVKKGLSKPMFFGWGHYLPVDDAISGKKLRYIKVFDPQGKAREIGIKKEKSLHSYLIKYDQVGTYCLAAETNPGYYAIYRDKDGKVHHATKPKSELAVAKDIILSVLASQSTKAYVICREPSEQTPGPVGLQLELMPLLDLTRVKPGHNLQLEVLFKGKRFEGKGKWAATYNSYSTAAGEYFYQETEAEGGRFIVPITRPGIWFIRFTIEKKASGEKALKCDNLRYKSTLVFQVWDNKKQGRKGGLH